MVRVETPGLYPQTSSRAHPPAMLHQIGQEAHLQGADVDLGAVDEDVVAVDVQLERTDDVAAALGRGVGSDGRGAARAEDGADPQDQLADAEWLDDVVVGAQLETDHPVDLLALGGQHHHRRLAGGGVAPDPPADLGPRDVGQHEVQQHDVGREPLHRLQTVGAVLGCLNREAGGGQVVGQQLAKIGLVLDDQDPSIDVWFPSHSPPQ